MLSETPQPHIDELFSAANVVAALIRNDRFSILNEAELQHHLYLALCRNAKGVPATAVPPSVVSASELGRAPLRHRAFREMLLDPAMGRTSPRPDISLLRPTLATAVPKGNGGISTWKGEFEALIETKLGTSASKANKDPAKYPEHLRSVVRQLLFDERSEGLSQRGDTLILGARGAVAEATGKSPRDLVDACREAIRRVHDTYCQSPASLVREKDFESWLALELESILSGWRCPIVDGGRTVGATSPVRMQVSTTLFPQRRHDVLVIDKLGVPSGVGSRQPVLSSAVEVEIKTSHSNQHNWFDGRLDGELSKMTRYREETGGKPIFVMFRLGAPIFIEAYRRMAKQYSKVEFHYLCSDGTIVPP